MPPQPRYERALRTIEKRADQTAQELNDPFASTLVRLVTARLRRLNPRPRTIPLALAVLSHSVLEYINGRIENSKILAITALAMADPTIHREVFKACLITGQTLKAQALIPELKWPDKPEVN